MVKPFKRTLSSSNVTAANEIHDYISHQTLSVQAGKSSVLPQSFVESTLTLSQDFKYQDLSEIVNFELLKEMTNKKLINWFLYSRTLLILFTKNDGNSLFHAVCLYMFGIHDYNQNLRKILYFNMRNDLLDDSFKKRWITSQQSSKDIDWNMLTEMASDKYCSMIKSDKPYAELTSIHIFLIAHIFGRPIIVIGDSGSDMDGVYLPLGRSANECERSPILLIYNNDQFYPAVSTENNSLFATHELAQHCIPLVYYHMNTIPVRFLFAHEMTNREKLLSTYLDLSVVRHEGINVLTAFLNFKMQPAQSQELMSSYLRWPVELNDDLTLNNINTERIHPKSRSLRKCYTLGCQNLPLTEFHGWCESCADKNNATVNLPKVCCLEDCENLASSDNEVGLCANCFNGGTKATDEHNVPIRHGDLIGRGQVSNVSVGKMHLNSSDEEFESYIHSLPPLPDVNLSMSTLSVNTRHANENSGSSTVFQSEISRPKQTFIPVHDPTVQGQGYGQRFPPGSSNTVNQKMFGVSYHSICRKCLVNETATITSEFCEACTPPPQMQTCVECGVVVENDELLCDMCHEKQLKIFGDYEGKQSKELLPTLSSQGSSVAGVRNVSSGERRPVLDLSILNATPCANVGCLMFAEPPSKICMKCQSSIPTRYSQPSSHSVTPRESDYENRLSNEVKEKVHFDVSQKFATSGLNNMRTSLVLTEQPRHRTKCKTANCPNDAKRKGYCLPCISSMLLERDGLI